MANPPIGQRQLITAEQFNELASQFATYWSDDVPNARYQDLNASTKEIHSKGWGQDPVVIWSPHNTHQKLTVLEGVRTTDVIYAEHTNTVVAQINAGVYHTHIDGSCTYLPMYPVGSKIYASSYFLISSFISGFEQTRFNLNPMTAELMMDPTEAAVEDGFDSQFESQAYAKYDAVFQSYQHARYFFNSGGEICFDLTAIGGNSRGLAWANTFNIIGDICSGATATTNSGYGVSPTVSYGFYDILPGEYKEIFNVKVDRGSGEYGEYGWGEYGEYSDYGSGEYDSAVVRIKATIIETEENFTVRYTVFLDENQSLSNVVMLDMSAIVGYKLPLDAPQDEVFSAGSISSNFKINHVDENGNLLDSTNYQFIERQPPIILIDTSWVLV